MERLALALIATCALIGAALAPEHSGTPDTEATGAVAPRPASGPARPESDSDARIDPVVADLLRRFEIYHTTLTDGERLRLAKLIVVEANAHGLDPQIVMAVIEVESALYPLAVSHIGAIGLMQLLPSTAQELAEELELPWRGPDTLFDPFLNVRLGTAYLRKLSDRYRGDLDTALAAYNWGPGRIDRRLRNGARIPSEYVRKVHHAAGRARLASSGTAGS